jgi:hypothetical protein
LIRNQTRRQLTNFDGESRATENSANSRVENSANSNAPATAKSAESNAPATTSTKKRISAAAVKELAAYFDEKNCSRNSTFRDLHMNATSYDTSELDAIVKKILLESKQLERQFNNWKGRKYEYKGNVYDLGPEEINLMLKERLPEDATGLSMTLSRQ